MFKDLVTDIKNNIRDPFMVIAGGSRVTSEGHFMDAQSDYDMIVLSHNEKQIPISYNNYHGRADIVIRTPDSLAFEILHAQNSRNGAVLDMIAHGQVLYDPLKLGTAYQKTFRQIYQQGPWPLHTYHLQETYDHLQQQTAILAAQPKGTIGTMAASYWLAHEAAKFQLDTENGWHKSGKMLGRYTHAAHPEKHAEHIKLFRGQATDLTLPKPPERITPMCGPVERIYLHIAGNVINYHDPDYVAYECRQDPLIEKRFMADTNKLIAQAAKNGFRYRWTAILNNIKPRRYYNASHEYDYALAKAVKSLTIYNSTKDTHKNGVESVMATVESYPEVFRYFPVATKGNPELFKDSVVNVLLKRRGGLWMDQTFRRKSPHGHRLDGFTANNLPQKIISDLKL